MTNFPFRKPEPEPVPHHCDGLFAARCAISDTRCPGLLFVAEVYVPAGPDCVQRAWKVSEVMVELAVRRLSRFEEED